MALLAIILLTVAGLCAALVLAYRHAPLWIWGIWAAVLGFAGPAIGPILGGPAPGAFGWTLALLPALVLLVLGLPPIRILLVTGSVRRMVKRILPRVSRTEQEALDAGTTGWDAELFSGRPRWNELMALPAPTLTAEEQAFLDGPVDTVCRMLDDWDIRHNRADLPPEVWTYLRQQRFFGMLIAKEHGGLGFSAQAQSQVVSKLASRSVTAGITVMVPNSLGPGELIEKYGTEGQKSRYLGPLARGEEIPCFALTGPHAGSDAAGMRDIGVVVRELVDGKPTLGVRLTWDKRYITLAPVATLIGLAFHLVDPDHLLGETEQVGITLALLPATTPGVSIGRRHYPSRSAFMNGPIQGRNVFIPVEDLIGGAEMAGHGWRMLMECLATGRAISLPAIGSVSIKQALRVTSAYARVRRQFGIPIGQMEGVAEPIGRMVTSAYAYEAARALTATMVDQGQRPAVLSALLKYRTTEAMRLAINDAMDIHGGRAVQDGPSNYLFAAYATTPVAITVEGANILTRSLITFAQGALRAHPWLYAEIAAANTADQKAGKLAFDRAFCGHVSFMLGNIAGSLWHGLTGGRFAGSPVTHELAPLYRRLARYAQGFALVGDWTVAFLGGDLKRKQRLSGRLADILADLYLVSATLKRFEDDGRIAEDRPIVEAVARDAFFAIEQNFAAFLRNFPNRILAGAMGFLVFPLGRHARPASDRESFRLVRAVLAPSAQRDRLTPGLFISTDPRDVTGSLEDALLKVTRVAEIETKFLKGLKKGQIARRLDRDAVSEAVAAGIITELEASELRLAELATERVVRVDDFEPDALARAAVIDTHPTSRAAE